MLITATGYEIMRIENIIDSEVVYAKGVCYSGRRWVCNIIRLAKPSESEILRKIISKEESFCDWYRENITRPMCRTQKNT